MTLRFTLFVAISVLVHAGALLWSKSVELQFQLGGEAQALRVSIAAVESAAPHQPDAPADTTAQTPADAANPQTVSDLVTLHAAEEVVSHSDAQHSARTTTTMPGLPGKTMIEQVSQTDHPSLRKARESTNVPAAKQSAPDIGKRISVALKNRISSHFVYPWLARQRGWEGQVLLSLTVRGNGDLGNWKVAHTSGYRTLDQSALKAARLIERLPQAASWLNGESLEVEIPVQYRLLDS